MAPAVLQSETRQQAFGAELAASNSERPVAFQRPKEEDVARQYVFINGDEVDAFLAGNPRVVTTLLAALPAAEEVFGHGVRLTVQVLADQDGDDVSLFVRIQTPKPVLEALTLRKQFYRDWWMQQPHVLEMPLSFDVEIV